MKTAVMTQDENVSIANLTYFRSETAGSGIDREANRIHGAAILQIGPLNDDRPWDVDEITLQQLVEFGNRPNKGVKSRFMHPDITTDGMGRHLGRFQQFRVDGDVVRADLSMAPPALERDYGKYVMDFVASDPEMFGNSPAIVADLAAMRKTFDPKTGRMKVRIKGLKAIDVVDDPAATRSGFFSSSAHAGEAAMATDLNTPESPAAVMLTNEQFSQLTSSIQTFSSKITDLESKLATLPQQIEEGRAAEQKRLAEINALFATFGCSSEATTFFSTKPNGTVDEARAMVLEAIQKRGGGSSSVPGGSNDEPGEKDPDAMFKTEYAKDEAYFKSKGHTLEDYILSRKIDAGLEPLVPANL